jgi:NAD(P)-dependent dehydrogenase (short-subunit alcohol dehydrogenase family)
MQHKRIALVTGTNQGVGLQVAKELVANGVTVLVGSRNFEHGKTAAKASELMLTPSSSTLAMRPPLLRRRSSSSERS